MNAVRPISEVHIEQKIMKDLKSYFITYSGCPTEHPEQHIFNECYSTY